MKLHLHLGAHKTATTHFQNVMERNRRLYQEAIHYVPMQIFRENVTHGDRLFNPACFKKVNEYLDSLLRINKRVLIVSDENLLGNAEDIYDCKVLYRNAKDRTVRLSDFVSKFEDANIWLSVRSMDTFIPSIYCESLLHWGFRKFGDAFEGHYDQRWGPLVSSLSKNFPRAKINVVPYESYCAVLPRWVEQMTEIDVGWDFLEEERPRKSLSHLAINMMRGVSPFIPSQQTPRVVQALSKSFAERGWGKKFSPFDKQARLELKALYRDDLDVIRGLGGRIRLFEV